MGCNVPAGVNFKVVIVFWVLTGWALKVPFGSGPLSPLMTIVALLASATKGSTNKQFTLGRGYPKSIIF